MPRDLADVLHLFLDDAEATRPDPALPAIGAPPPAVQPGAAGFSLPRIGLPMRAGDVQRATFAWNLAFEIARGGGWARLIVPRVLDTPALWPRARHAVEGFEPVAVEARDLPALCATAERFARLDDAARQRGGAVLVVVPQAWLRKTTRAPDPGGNGGTLGWWLLLCRAREAGLEEAAAWIERLHGVEPGAEVGVTLSAADDLHDARAAFDALVKRCLERGGRKPASYGLYVDDLDVARAIAGQQPLSEVAADGPAARAVADVARLVHEDARSRCLG